MLHVHGNVKDSEEGLWVEHVSNSISEIAKSEGISISSQVQALKRICQFLFLNLDVKP